MARPPRLATPAAGWRGIDSANYRSVDFRQQVALDMEKLTLPFGVTGFSPGGEPDFGAKSKDDPQAAVYHDFRGSWKIKGSE